MPVNAQGAKKDVVIALAILVVLLLLWRLMTRPAQFGASGAFVKTNVFGTLGTQIGHSLLPARGDGSGQGGGIAGGAGRASNDAGLENRDASAGPAVEPTTGAAREAGTNKTWDTNLPLKVVAALPDEEVPAPLTNSANAAAMAERLGEANAKTGEIQFSLFWANRNDLDLHCFDPAGQHIFFRHKKSEATGGELDVDRNASEPFTDRPVENIYWPRGGAPGGVYKLFVVHYNTHGHSDPTTFTVRTVVAGRTNFFQQAVRNTGQRELHWICSIQYDPANPDPTRRSRFLPYR